MATQHEGVVAAPLDLPQPGRLQMRWFGKRWNAIVCYEVAHARTPVGTLCGYCQKPIKKNTRGLLLPSPEGEIPYELSCFLQLLGLDEGGTPRE